MSDARPAPPPPDAAKLRDTADASQPDPAQTDVKPEVTSGPAATQQGIESGIKAGVGADTGNISPAWAARDAVVKREAWEEIKPETPSTAAAEADDMELDHDEDKTAAHVKGEPPKDEVLAPPSFTPSPSPPPRSGSPVRRHDAGPNGLKVEDPSSPLAHVKQGSSSPKPGLGALDDLDDSKDDGPMKRSSSHASASSSADRKVRKSASAMPPQLITHLPRAEREAMTTFVELPSNDYHDKKLGRTRGRFQEAMVCDCSFTPGVDDESLACSAYSDCINRATQIECTASDCNCGEYCQNQRFQRRQYADVEIVLTENKGFGLRAASDLPTETFIYEYVGEVMNEPTFLQRMQQYRVEGIRHFYFMMLQKGEYLDATKKGGKGRFINHSCNPNCFVAKWQVGKHMRMGIFAKRDIARGEELTFDYNVDRYGNDAQTCYCGEANCVGTLGGKTQTDIGGIADLFIQALGIEDQVEQMEARGTKKRKSKELDKDFVPILRPVKEDEVFKVMTGIRQANANQQILQKLLTRVEMTEDPSVQKRLVKLHGFDAMYGVLVDWHDDRNIIMLALSSLARWPLIAKNKVVDSGIEGQVIVLRDFYRERSVKKEAAEADPDVDAGAVAAAGNEGSTEAKEDLAVSRRAEQLLDAWNKLDMGYRIARREADDAAAADAARADAGFVSYIDRRRMHDLEEPPVTLEEAQAPNAVSEELGKPMPDWSRSEDDHDDQDEASAAARAGGNEKRLRRMIGEIVVKQMSKHKDEFERETFKKYAKELTNVIVSKEMKNPKYWPPPGGGTLEELSGDKRTKVKAFCGEYIAKLLAKKGRVAAGAGRQLPSSGNAGAPSGSNRATPSSATPR
ncbi:uncharacterized protein PFL1_01834 [Pseudozyma flocculosa PF-1]|uniref:uncharacterized protein n=1 Tax=Pseudozyma flocculosa PF-1 TaxID=1277687 RepID=UPI00045609D4|nr:uncharacterized protein PFL1_01834 [Pseudozyma flocculosa PF-1]EPQ30936.1 hypothetical protein PFL1_01834 [Pseudozyma flocculosa PF-1]